MLASQQNAPSVSTLQGDPELYVELVFRIAEPVLGQMSSGLAHVNLGTYHYNYPNFITITWAVREMSGSKHEVRFCAFFPELQRHSSPIIRVGQIH